MSKNLRARAPVDIVQITPSLHSSGDVRVYEYGVRLDKDCLQAANDQIFAAHQLYNRLVACIRDTVNDMQAYLVDHAGPDAKACQNRIEALNEAFAAARTDNDEARMKSVAEDRRSAWREMSTTLRAARTACRSELQERFFSRIGKKATCETYRLRCEAVAGGLGWATANATLDAALIAFKKSFARGRAPRFAKATDSTQDTLTLQFTAAGGVNVDALLEGRNSEFSALPSAGCGRHRYGSFHFRLGAAKDKAYASGTWQYHRALPPNGSVGLVRLVRRRLGPKTRWWLQFQVRSPLPSLIPASDRKRLATVHLGWASDLSGRRIAGIADAADPGCARILQLPPQIEAGLQQASRIEAERTKSRDAVVALLKAHAWDENSLAQAQCEVDDLPVDETHRIRAALEILALRRLPAQHIAIRRLHRLAWLLRDTDALPDWLEAWRKEDKLRWQEAAFAAKRARNRRKGFYRQVALELATAYQAIGIESLDLATAAKKIDEITGERSEFTRKARSGRVVAAVYELESAIRWAAVKHNTAIFDLAGGTATICAYCGGKVQPDPDNLQQLNCNGCGADIDRKRNGAALAYQAVQPDVEHHIEDFWHQTLEAQECAKAKRQEKKEKMASSRKTARSVSADDLRAAQ